MSRHKVYNRNQPEIYHILREFRALLDEYSGKASVDEIYVLPPGDPKLAASFLGAGNNLLHLAFDFSLLFCAWNARAYYRAIRLYYDALPSDNQACFAFSNHDVGRSLNRFGRTSHTREKARLLAVLLLTLKGMPFIYYGDELGMSNARIPRRQIRDRYGKMFSPFYRGRDAGRTPMQWNSDANAGFSAGEPCLPLHKNYREVKVESETADENSVLNAYRKMIELRKTLPALQQGEIQFVETGRNGILSYTRTPDGQEVMVLLNFSSRKQKVTCLSGNCKLLFSTHRKVADSRDNVLFPFEAIVLEKF